MRPGPLSVGSDKIYSENKIKGDFTPLLHGTKDILKETYGSIIYQEQIMLIAKVVCCVNDNQADKLFRKAISKKKKDLFILCRQVFIYGKINKKPPTYYDYENKEQPYYDPKGKYGPDIKGGINNGYKKEDLIKFFNDLKEYASYLFNKSHAVAYAFVCICTLYEMAYNTSNFMAAILTMQDKKEDIDKYIRVSRNKGLIIKTPDINNSEQDFIAKENTIYMSLCSLSGIGFKTIPSIISNRPYNELKDLLKINKKAAEAFIKSGSFDNMNKNRYALLNEYSSLKKIKDFVPYEENKYNEYSCMELEKDALGTYITHLPYWENIEPNSFVNENIKILEVNTRQQKNKKEMAFIKAEIKGYEIECIAFATVYCKNKKMFEKDKIINIKGKKDEQNKLIINKISKENTDTFIENNIKPFSFVS